MVGFNATLFPLKVYYGVKSENGSGYGVDGDVVGDKRKQHLVSQDPHHHSNRGYVKYPELYPSQEYSKYDGSEVYYKYPDALFPGQYNSPDYLDLFPVDTPNTIPTSADTDFKQRHDDGPGNDFVPNNSVAAASLQQPANSPEEAMFDISALLAFPDTTGSVQDSFVGWELLEGLEPTHQLKEAELVQQLEGRLPDEIYSLPGVEKDPSYNKDPSYHNLHTEPDGEMLSPVSDQYQQLATPMDQSPDSSPSSQPTPVAMVPMMEEVQGDAGGSGIIWRKDLQNLFEKTFDLNELANDFMLVPSPHSDHQQPSLLQTPPPKLDKKPVILDPPLATTPPPKQHGSKEEIKPKPTPTLLFGRHEGEIIHKLLALKKGSRSKPVTRDKLISMPVEEFNSLLEQARLTEIEVAFMKEWRRRGKNKAAAQIARKRKREEVSGLDQEVHNMRQEKAKLEKKCRHLHHQVAALKERARKAEEKIYKRQSSLSRQPVGRDTHHILITEDEQLLLVPRASSK